MADTDAELDPLLEYLLGGYGSGAMDYMPLYGRRTLGGMTPTRPLEPPEIPSVNASALGQDIGGPGVQDPSQQMMDPYLMYLMSMGQGGLGGPGGPRGY